MPSIPSHCSCGAGKAPSPITVQVTGKPSRGAQLGQLRGGVGVDHPAAGVDHRAPRVGHRLGGQADLLLVALGGGLVAGQRDVVDRVVLDVGAREVLRDVHQHRARPPAASQVEGLVDGARDLQRVLDHERVLDDRQRDAVRVGLLEAVGADQLGAHLPGDEHRGTESIIASQIGVTRLVAPGPEVPNATPTLPVALA